MDKPYFIYSSPESAGIPSSVILDAVESLDSALVPIHSLIVMRDRKIASEAYWAPWDKDRLHRMYSCTKSFASIAIGCLLRDGKLSLSDPIVKHFPEYDDERSHSYMLESTSVRDLLMMASCHRRTAYKEGSSCWSYIDSFSGHDWVKPFFTVEPDHAPGTLFIYDTSAAQVLTALAEKLSGMDLLSYLKKEFFRDPEFFRNAYILKEPGGYSAGGSGLMCTPADLLYAMSALMEGCSDDIMGPYLRDAVSKRIDNSVGSRSGLADMLSGYGYQIWMNTHGYMFYGMGSQLALAVPDKNMVIVTTADTQGCPDAEGAVFRAAWSIADSASGTLPENPEAESRLKKRISSLSVHTAPGSATSPVSSLISGRTFRFPQNPLVLESLECTLEEKKGRLSFIIGGERFSVSFGIGQNAEESSYLPHEVPSVSSASWQSEDVLGILVRYIGTECGTLIAQLAFRDGRLTVYMRQIGELSVRPINGVATSL